MFVFQFRGYNTKYGAPANKFLFSGGAPANKFLLPGRAPANNLFLKEINDGHYHVHLITEPAIKMDKPE